MGRVNFFGFGGLALASTLALATACGGSVSQGGSGGGGQGAQGGQGGGIGGQGGVGGQGGDIGGQGGFGGVGVGGGGGQGAQGGQGGSLPACSGGQNVVLAVDRILLGDTDPDGTPNYSSGWKQYGMNLDGLVSDKLSVNLCKPAAGGSPAAVYPDGKDGIDNGFGKNILPILLGLSNDISPQANQELQNGNHSYLLSIAGPGQQSSCVTESALFLGDALGMPPAWNGADLWPIDPTSLSNPPDPTSSLCKLADTRITPNGLTAELGGQIDLLLPTAGLNMRIRIHHVRLAMQLSPDQKSATAGQLGGIVDREELAAEIAKVAAAFDTSFCDPSSPTLQSILKQIRQASDILTDGTQDPSKECNGISIGVGFTMKSAQLGGVATPAPPPPDPCVP